MSQAPTKDQLLELAKQHLTDNRFDRAILEYQRILQLDPKDQRVRLRLAELFVRQKNIKQAVETYNTVAAAYIADGFYLKAVTVYKSLLKINPSLHEANVALAELYEKMGLVSDAVHQYQIQLRTYEERGAAEQVLELRKRIVALEPDNVTSRVRLAECYQVQGDDDASLQEYEILAEQLKETGTEEQLIDLYTKILSRRPENLEVLHRLCTMYARRGELRQMLQWMATGAKLVAADPVLMQLQATAFLRLNQMESARNKLKELAEWQVKQGAPEEAIKVYEELLVAIPEAADEIGEAVDALRPGAMEEISESAEIRRRMIAEAPPEASPAPLVADVAAREMKAAERASRGKSDAAPAGNVAPSPARTGQLVEAACALARAFTQMGMPEEAAQEWRKARTGLQQLIAAGVATAEQRALFAQLDQAAP